MTSRYPFEGQHVTPQELEDSVYYGRTDSDAEQYMITTVTVSIFGRGSIFRIMKSATSRFAGLVVRPTGERGRWGGRIYHLHVRGPAWQVLLFNESLNRYRRKRDRRNR